MSCNEAVQKKEESPGLEQSEETKSLLERAKRHVEAQLNIPATEKYKIEILETNLDPGSDMDAVISVNQLQRAQKEAEEDVNITQRANTGFLGNFNTLFLYNGESKEFTRPIKMPSSANVPLKVIFQNITTEAYSDIIVEYRIRDAAYRNYFGVRNRTPFLMFQWKVFDSLTYENPVANYFELGAGSVSLVKDILIYEGKITNKINEDILGELNLEIEKKEALKYRFFFDPKSKKYLTVME
ncbi:MAG: hypothetical protein ACI9G9_001223 [Psychromonas sp.]|jgi:hypothetical protein